jgi:hypothetical protein
MPAMFDTNAGWGPSSALDSALEARARAVLIRHRAAFSRRFALIGPSGDGAAQDTEPTATQETVEEFLARTSGAMSVEPSDS